MQKLTILIIAILLLTIKVFGQTDSCWTVLVIKKGSSPDYTKAIEGKFNPDGFYLFKNCIYEIDLKDKRKLSGRLIDISKDTLSFTNYFNQNVAFKAQTNLDTIKIHYRQLDKLNLISDRALGLYEKHSFDNFDFIFKKDTNNCILKSHWHEIFSNDNQIYELVPHLTAQGVDLLFEESGRTYYFYGAGMTKPDRSKMDNTYDKKNFIWFTPCNVEEINGIAIGLYTKNIKNREFNERDSLIVRGLSLEINPFSILAILFTSFDGPYPDSINIYYEKIKNDWEVKINGVNISLVNTINEMEIRGFNFTPLVTVIDEVHGVTISGLNNFCYILNGVSIAGLRNRATIAKGLQIGLFNKSTDMRGIQIGLWNTNAKRSLPLINWQFRPKKNKLKST